MEINMIMIKFYQGFKILEPNKNLLTPRALFHLILKQNQQSKINELSIYTNKFR